MCLRKAAMGAHAAYESKGIYRGGNTG
jgi:hypothetical protein